MKVSFVPLAVSPRKLGFEFFKIRDNWPLSVTNVLTRLLESYDEIFLAIIRDRPFFRLVLSPSLVLFLSLSRSLSLCVSLFLAFVLFELIIFTPST